jgi:large subunit ribosomal protein L20
MLTRINAASRQHGLSYSQLTGKLKQANVGLNRKMLAQLAMLDPQAFAKVVEVANQAD